MNLGYWMSLPYGRDIQYLPDWVLSRQRAWGVPITLFINRKTGDYLVDEAVNARIVAAVRAQGIDAWTPETAHSFLGDAYDHDEWEAVSDILDVWFDSGTSHAYVLDSGRWPDLSWPADIYVEGSDQHRGWFQSSLLEACATRGRAPYDRILTHGFTMDAKGMKMSKSLGNTIDPIKVMESYGADIIRLWALSVDFTEDHRIGDEILKGVSDQYRKIRNTFRYMLGALEGFSEDERVADVAAMPELEHYMLHRLAAVDAAMRLAVDTFDFNSYVRTLADFCNDDLSAFYFDIRKDCLYCDVGPAAPLGTDKRRAYRSVLDTLFHALVRYAAPVLVFTAEEVWGTRYPDEGSVHLLEWPVVDAGWSDGDLFAKWEFLRGLRGTVLGRLENLRRDKVIGSSLEAEVVVESATQWALDEILDVDLGELCIVSKCRVELANLDISLVNSAMPLPNTEAQFSEGGLVDEVTWSNVIVTRTTHHKCGRCWRHLPEVIDDGSLCHRCATVLGE